MTFQPRPLNPNRSVRHFYGSEMRRLRGGAGMSLARLAEVLKYSKPHLGRIETAESMIPEGLSEKLDAAFGTDGHFTRLYELARHEVHPDKYRRYMDFEARAESIAHWSSCVVPGLLQTEAYARELLSAGAGEATEEEIEQRVAARLSRRERLRGNAAPHVWVVLDESVIWRQIGGPKVMHEQLAALLPLMDTPRSKIQVLPYSHGAHRLIGGDLDLLVLPDSSMVAYDEGIDASHLYEGETSVQERRRAYDVLRAYALTPKESARLIRTAMEVCESCPSSRS
ncbi:helix-turn-helix transcriptional regulator [Streptomyces sp. ME19-01-6]|uniref:helix-turn-helix domain-containing protein n=1 Tax=Streptomyces sp. ME19-01-6 TaxID=3028686 RepID=UPI0029BF0431|nr:helix-turn-helix transcriptional regulator [Streptomyces sp. ME19-01-6]MDX3225602.1 helix-turn-helix transcriptional regulator [Streptomyces sp. ME19-01-6]